MRDKGQGMSPEQGWQKVQGRRQTTETHEQQANELSFFWSDDEHDGQVHQNGGAPNAENETPTVKYAEVAKLNGAGAITVKSNGVVSYPNKPSIAGSKQDTKQQNKAKHKTQHNASTNDPGHSQPDPAVLKPRTKGEITDRLLTRWLTSGDPTNVLYAMTSMQTALERFLKPDFIKNDWFFSFVKAVELATKAAHIRHMLLEVLEILCANKFFSKHALQFFHLTIPKHGCDNRVEAMKALADILMCMLYVLPAKATTCISTSVQLRNVINSSKDLQSIKELREKFDTLYNKAKEMYTSINKQTSASEIQSSDVDEKSPENFRDIPAYPILKDVNRNSDIRMQKAVVEGAYTDVEQYLDVQFRLMREDFIIPLRKGIAELRNSPDKIRYKTSDLTLRLYHGARINREFEKHRLRYSVRFDVTKMRNINWEASKRLINGSLVCLSKDNFTTIIFATVCCRDKKKLRSGEIEVDIKSSLDVLFSNSPYDVYVMAEATNLFEPYFHVLKGFHQMSQTMPFQEYVIRCETTLKPPRYLFSKVLTVPTYNLSCLMNTDTFWMCPVLNTLKWPSCENMCLNKSQREAAMLALTKDMALIQGPPGTGKTYVGLKVMEAIMKNLDVVFGHGPATPILIVCYTNHALDQFLEGILKFCDDGIVRVGGRSKSEKLQPFLLNELKQNRKNIKRSNNNYFFKARDECFENMKLIVTKINQLSQQLATLKSDVKSEDYLWEYIDDVHYDSLCNDCPESGYKISKMAQWLNSEEEDHQESLRKRIEDFLYKLVLNWDFTISIDEASNLVSMNIQGRASLYYTAVSKLREELENEMAILCMQNQTKDFATKAEELKEKIKLTRSQILSDAEIERFLPEYECIQRFMKGKNVQDGMMIQTWIIGPNRGISDQFNDIEILIRGMGITGVDYFDSKDISSNELTTIDNDEDDIDKDDYFTDDEYSSVDRDTSDEGDELTVKDYMNYNKMSDQVSRLLHLVQNSEESSWTVVDTKKNMQLLPGWMTEDPMTERQAASITNIWKLNETEKHSLYNLWIQRYRQNILERLQSLLDVHDLEAQKMEEFRNEENLLILKSAKIIGMTTTGAAKHRSLLEAVGCKIIVLEEAAEIFESHVITALNAQCNHLILIGDHQQLRPKPNVYELARHYGLEVSLFERLIKNNVPHVVLKVQHRMRPEISKLMRHIYPELEDDDSVLEYEHIRGVEKDVYFINHNSRESQVDDSLSKENIHEAKYMVALCQYLLKQDYSPQSITILTTYAGQLLALKRLATNTNLNQSVRIAVVDDFQGEENDIILLSLVRSNEKKSVGFLKIENRICVALSRAKKGLYVIGNFSMLSSQSELWRKIVDETQKCNMIGDGLSICCPSHPENKLVIRSAKDFRLRPEGGCGNPCEKRLSCGHVCDLPCHGYDPQHIEYQCKKRCARTCKDGHPCRRQCYKDCGFCEVFVTKSLKCGHEEAMPCGKDPDDHDCETRCPEILDCSHQCSGKCGRCSRHREHPRCETKVAYQFHPCEDIYDIPCYKTKEDPPCERICNEILDCKHRCKGICSDCSKNGHIVCPEVCKENLDCGHTCKGRCKDCTRHEKHALCKEKCNAKLECEHQCLGRCGDCSEKPHPKCKQTCKGILACSHQCKGICWNCTENTHEQCKEKCNAVLSCNHICEGYCGVCSLKGHSTCRRPCKKELACKHFCNRLCGQCSENGHPKCVLQCSATLDCNHKCTGKCDDCSEKGHHAKCLDKCKKKLPCKHICKGDCGECSEKGHRKCLNVCNQLLPCRHKCQGVCGECAENGIHSKCLEQCRAKLDCKHICKGQCGDCSQGAHKQCEDKCKALFRCGHRCTADCGSCKEGLHKPCPADCIKDLPCGHRCTGVCGICQDSGQHNECQEKCTKTLICGHKCAGKCGQPCLPCIDKCPFSCKHGSCCGKVAKHLCGQPCNPCRSIDFFRCDHGQINRYCFEKWPTKPCELTCAKRLKVLSIKNNKMTVCRHPCAGICGEICVCKVCENVRTIKQKTPKVLNIASPRNQNPNKQERLIIKLPSCSHIFFVDELDNYVYNYDPNGTKFITCPACPKLITNCPRYENISKEHFAKRESLKSQGIVYIPGPVSREPEKKKKRGDKNVPKEEDEVDIPDFVAAAVAATEQSQTRGGKKNNARNVRTDGDHSNDWARESTAEIDKHSQSNSDNKNTDGIKKGRDDSCADAGGVEESEKKNHSSRKKKENSKTLKSNQHTSSSSACVQAGSVQEARDAAANDDGDKGGELPAAHAKLTKKQKKMNKHLSKMGGHEAAASTSSGAATPGNGFQNGGDEKRKKEYNCSPFKRRKRFNSARKSAEQSATSEGASGGNSYNPSTDDFRKNRESSRGFEHADKDKNKGKKYFTEESKAQDERPQREKDEDKDSKSKKNSTGKKKHH